MKYFKLVVTVSVAAFVGACASSTTTQLARNIVRIDVSAAPACGAAGARNLVSKLAAVETIRLGYDKYLIAEMGAENNVRVVGANYNTTGTLNTFGNTSTFSGNTTATPIVSGTPDAAIVAVMFEQRDPEAANAIDAKTTLGANWDEIVAKGTLRTCLN
ncbi:hypothetical protein [Ruegeria sp. R14_0]|uniref:hypothetical protein n=1 Tax=Ruegeria sp. R14_0 TaxID=2821100 RepID=UPI001ADBC9F5|nr:hypothetical protein [Ruegeria sp. R14_0]MBO9448064.1 hypothetical protein [Ruegeria sp. R14_0]